MSDQWTGGEGQLLPRHPESLIEEAIRRYQPVASFCLFSGGDDSKVLAHRCRDFYDELVFIDTGTAVDESEHGGPSVRKFVQEFAAWIDKPLRIYDAGDAYEKLVLEHGGFPGPAGHGRAYTRLKERQIEALVRDSKQGEHRRSKVMLLTGKRAAESKRRTKTTLGIDPRGGQLYVNPLVDWTRNDMLQYRLANPMPESDVALLLHRSGECNCGAFAEPGEAEMLASLFPCTWRRIAALEDRARAAGVPACEWGKRPPEEPVDAGPLCSSCEFRFDLDDAA